uniref:Uncharacterized protein n=1 Tax=Aegilops tauschii subsp. strangulata TaxID=200361 RepID=A0A453E897_AEGTS
HLRHFFQLLSRSLVGWMVAVGQRPAAAMSQALRPRWSVLWPSRLPVIRQARPGTAAVSFNNRCNGVLCYTWSRSLWMVYGRECLRHSSGGCMGANRNCHMSMLSDSHTELDVPESVL